MKGNTIYQGDCLEILKGMEDNSVDLCLCDPQYGKKCDKGTHGYGSSDNRKYSDTWDKKPPSKQYFEQIRRVSKNQIIFGGNYFKLPVSNCWIVWDKIGDIKFNNPFADCELAWTSFNSVIKKYTVRQQGFIKDTKDKRYHPTQKPSELFIQILKDYSEPNNLILDPFCGSGTTCVAAEELGRRWIGIDISPVYVDIARKRIQEAKDKYALFEVKK